jgi:hypothetical protein
MTYQYTSITLDNHPAGRPWNRSDVEPIADAFLGIPASFIDHEDRGLFTVHTLTPSQGFKSEQFPNFDAALASFGNIPTYGTAVFIYDAYGTCVYRNG